MQVIDSNGSSLILAGKDEDDLTKWMQALCMAASGVEVRQGNEEFIYSYFIL